MQEIYVFVAGIVFIAIFFPILQSISDIFLTLSQWIISIFNIHIADNNAIIQDIQDRIQPTSSQAIGFQAPNEEEYYYDDDDEDNKIKTGFRG